MGRTWKRSPKGLTACRKTKWKTEDLEYIENCLFEEQRTYNSIQLARKLKQERAVDLSSDRLRRILKKKDIVGKEQDKATEKNRITQWHQLKTHEIRGQIFDNEYDLAMTVIQGMKSRSERGNYQLERFIFNSA